MRSSINNGRDCPPEVLTKFALLLDAWQPSASRDDAQEPLLDLLRELKARAEELCIQRSERPKAQGKKKLRTRYGRKGNH